MFEEKSFTSRTFELRFIQFWYRSSNIKREENCDVQRIKETVRKKGIVSQNEKINKDSVRNLGMIRKIFDYEIRLFSNNFAHSSLTRTRQKKRTSISFRLRKQGKMAHNPGSTRCTQKRKCSCPGMQSKEYCKIESEEHILIVFHEIININLFYIYRPLKRLSFVFCLVF